MKLKSQPRIQGVSRIPTGSSLLPDIRREIEASAKLFNCSKSFVVATALADFFQIHAEFRYDDRDEQSSRNHNHKDKKRNGHKKVINIRRKAAAA